MIAASTEYLAGINSKSRKLYSKIKVSYSDPLLDPTVTGESTDQNYISWTDQLINGRTEASHKYFEVGGQATLNGTFCCCPSEESAADANEMGWWSATIAGTDGSIDTTCYTEYSARKVSSYILCGDDKLNAYPVAFTVKLYDGSSNLLYTDTVTDNDLVCYESIFTSVDDVEKAVLNITEWSEPSTVVKITEFTTQVIEEYTDELLCNWSVSEERELSNDNTIPAGNISANQATFCLLNGTGRPFDANNTSSRLYGLVKPNAKVEIYLGINTSSGLEYQPIFSGWVTDWDVPETSKEVTATVQDRLNILSQTEITTSTVQQGLTFYEWFELVLADGGLAAEEYNIDSELDGDDYIVPYGWLDSVTHRTALETLAQGCMAVVYMDRYNIIQIKAIDSFDTTSVQAFTRSDYSNKSNQPVYDNITNKITVTTSPLVVTAGETVYETSDDEPEEIEGSSTDDFTIYYTDSPVSDITSLIVSPSVSGVTVDSYVSYSWGATVTVTNTNTTDQEFQLVGVGSTYEVSGQKTVTASDTDSINENGLNTYSLDTNDFIQTKTLATVIANKLLASFKDPQRDLSISFDVAGNPMIELGDPITVTDLYTSKDYKIVSQDISYSNRSISISQTGRV